MNEKVNAAIVSASEWVKSHPTASLVAASFILGVVAGAILF